MEEMEESEEEEMEESEEEENLQEPEEAGHTQDLPLMTPPGSQRRSVGLYVESEVHDDFILDELGSPPNQQLLRAADTIDSVKVRLCNILGIPPDQQRLKTSAGVLMENGKTLADYNIQGLEHISVTRDRGPPSAG